MTATRRNLTYLVSLIPPSLAIAGNLLGGPFAWTNFVFTFGVLAVLEALLGEEKTNVHSENDKLPNAILMGHVALQTGSLASLLAGVHLGILTDWALVGAILSTGTNTGASATVVAHELLHRKSKTMKWLSRYLLFTSLNFYFYKHHLIHHRLIATEEDAATARRGETLYSFVLRSMTEQLQEVWTDEAKRLRKKGAAPYGLRHYVVGSLLAAVLVFSSMGLLLGFAPLLAFVAQGLLGTVLLEYVNYIEHYGLRRQRSERINEAHSWQSDRVISRFFLVDLARHADHHYHGARPYHKLRTYTGSPVLPGGYAMLFPMALVPPIFFRAIHPRIDSFYGERDTDSDSGTTLQTA